jgi:hypothetical protein
MDRLEQATALLHRLREPGSGHLDPGILKALMLTVKGQVVGELRRIPGYAEKLRRKQQKTRTYKNLQDMAVGIVCLRKLQRRTWCRLFGGTLATTDSTPIGRRSIGTLHEVVCGFPQ